MADEITHNAADPGFNYYGRWQRGASAVTINSGSFIEFAYAGGACSLVFDVRGFSRFPAIFVQVDQGPIRRTLLADNRSRVTITPEYALPAGAPPFPTVVSGFHLIRCWVGTHSLYLTPAAGTQWAQLDGGCRFSGVQLLNGALIPLPYGSAQIEFLGDSITQGLRLLYTGSEDDVGQQLPYANWPQLTADLLGMKPVVTGFGGQGLSSAGTCGAPPANAAFSCVYQDVRWKPPVTPRAVVIYQGTNDALPVEAFQAGYITYLQTIRRAYPPARIFAVCPHNKGNYAPAIAAAVRNSADANIIFLDYSTGVISPHETCDGCHLNPGGAIRLASRLAMDLHHHLR